MNTNNIYLPFYFKPWFSGWVEVEGCFSIRKNNNHSFSIGQNDDLYLIKAINTNYFLYILIRITILKSK